MRDYPEGAIVTIRDQDRDLFEELIRGHVTAYNGGDTVLVTQEGGDIARPYPVGDIRVICADPAASTPITLTFYGGESHQLPTFSSAIDAAKTEIGTVPYHGGRTHGYAVLFELFDHYAIYVHPEDRYYSSYLPTFARVLAGGWWELGEPIEWTPIRNISEDEYRLLEEWFGTKTSSVEDEG